VAASQAKWEKAGTYFVPYNNEILLSAGRIQVTLAILRIRYDNVRFFFD
jgi:hypothetical protein